MERTLEHLLPLAKRAYGGISFSPEKRGESIVNDYSAEIDSDLLQIREAARNFGADTETIDAACSRYKTKYISQLSSYLSSQSNIVSTMIAVPSNFPVRQMQKRNQWAENKYTEFREFRSRAMKAILKSFRVISDPLEKAKKDLADRERAQVVYREINKIIRKHRGNPSEQIRILTEKTGISEASASKLLVPDFAGRIGIPSFSLTNNNANIKRLKLRVAELEAKSEKAESGAKSFEVKEVVVEYDYAEDRIRIKHESKPAYEAIQTLKRNGFKWSPRNTAWQRQITVNAEHSLCTVLNITIAELQNLKK